MALIKQIKTNHGLILENAYIKITKQTGNKDNINIIVSIFKDKQSSDENKESITQYVYNFTPNLEENFIKQGYEYLKTLNEFKNAVDC